MPHTNYVLVKSEVGKSRQPTRDLPSHDHVYGKPNKKDTHHAVDLLTTWTIPQTKEVISKESDFQKLNKAAIHVKATNPKAQAEFRNNNDIKRIAPYHRKLNGHEMF